MMISACCDGKGLGMVFLSVMMKVVDDVFLM